MSGSAASPQSRGGALVLRGIGFSVVGYFLFSLQDATIKWLASGFTSPQILFMRSVVVVPCCLVLFGPGVAPRALVSPMRFRLLVRSVVIVIAWAFYYTAARYLQLAELVTIYFSSPLLVAALAPIILKEHVTWSRWLSVGIGFAGVIVAVQPTHLNQPVPILLALAASALWAYTSILIRQVVAAASTPVVMFVSNITILVLCGALMPWLWQPPTWPQLALMLLVGCFGMGGQFMSTEAIRLAPASVVAPISFSSLVWAFLLGLAIWGDVPDIAVFGGAGLILASGAIVTGAEFWTLRGRRRALAASIPD
ncbi:MAG TPA: DMT family transporter [Stellaceae bacterium]|nr:DMT family transporter [Stellaceae bacterium]